MSKQEISKEKREEIQQKIQDYFAFVEDINNELMNFMTYTDALVEGDNKVSAKSVYEILKHIENRTLDLEPFAIKVFEMIEEEFGVFGGEK